jgi:hypothetical protein
MQDLGRRDVAQGDPSELARVDRCRMLTSGRGDLVRQHNYGVKP